MAAAAAPLITTTSFLFKWADLPWYLVPETRRHGGERFNKRVKTTTKRPAAGPLKSGLVD